MARKTQTVQISFDGRDKGKTFLLTEMSAQKAEEWAIRALSAMSRAGADIPQEAVNAGWGAIAFMGMKAILATRSEDSIPLYREMMDCVQSVQELATRPLIDEDIEEVATRLYLRDEVFRLHANFSIRESLSKVVNTLSQMGTQDTTSDTQISQNGSPELSKAV